MRIRIIGSCGSGKSTLAKQLSGHYGIPYYEIDNVIWDRSEDGLKYPEQVRDATFQAILDSESWIVEGVQYKEWTLTSIAIADFVFVLNPHVYVRDYRIVKRFILSRTGIRPWNYKQSLSNLRKMLVEWNHRYDVQQVIDLVKQYRQTPHIVRSRRDVMNVLADEFPACRC
ncbi:P-loop NTPase family protein [Cohnella fermenti]|uniref:DNA topology modulation protein FlaR n=1 Tax=Cohnella fermenti TaxID=2565925 RepID=A0A4S4CA95_9BACL|nr:hypothetical protein [Cohnella fermenti]THF84697.1 hypothetical protein E6C55_01630 [Cohnella fermenti]